MPLVWAHKLCISSSQGLFGQRRDAGSQSQEEEELNCSPPSSDLQEEVGASDPSRPQVAANCEQEI